MNNELLIDPLVIFFERHGLFLQTRQVEFCRFFIKHGSAVRAAKLAGYPDPQIAGPALYEMFGTTLQDYMKHNNFDVNLVLNNYRRMAQSTNRILINSDELAANNDAEPEYDDIPNDAVRRVGLEGLRKVLGLDAAQDLNLNVGEQKQMPASMREKLDRVYKQNRGE